MSITGEAGGPPHKVGVALVDVLAGLHAAAGILAGLHGGEGARIEVPLLDSGLAGLVNVAQNALVTGAEPVRYGNAHPNIVPYETFPTASGELAIAAANDGLFRGLCDALGLAELAADERYATNAARVEHRAELIPRLAERLRERPAEEWLPLAGRGRGPGGEGPHRARRRWPRPRPPGARRRSRSSTRPPGRSTWSPRRSGARPAPSPAPPPLLGEHTAEVLGELGRSGAEIEELARRGVVAVG